MSCNVLVVAEDFRTDRYILQPLAYALMAAAGRPRANVRVMTDPLMGGVDQALNLTRLQEVVDRYRLVDIFLLLVDRDGRQGRREALQAREVQLRDRLGPDRVLFGQEAWQEIEVWGLASQDLPAGWRWSDIRNEPHPKEHYFDRYVERRRIAAGLGGGRQTVGRDVGSQYGRVRSRCPEVSELETRVSRWLAER